MDLGDSRAAATTPGCVLLAGRPTITSDASTPKQKRAPAAHLNPERPRESTGVVAGRDGASLADAGSPTAGDRPSSSKEPTGATIRYPRRGTVSIYVGCLESSPSCRRSS